MHYLYLRVSTDKQADSQAGMNAQLDSCVSWCERNDIPFIHLAAHDDPGVRSKIHPFDRPGFGELMKVLKPGDCIVVAKRDRIARDTVMLCVLERELEKEGIKFISAEGVGNGDSPEDILVRRIVDAIAEYERALIRKRTKLGLQSKKRRGEVYCRDLYGYKNVDGQFVPDEKEQAVIHAMKANQKEGWSYRKIAEWLNGSGIKPPRGDKWHPNTIREILKREEESNG